MATTNTMANRRRKRSRLVDGDGDDGSDVDAAVASDDNNDSEENLIGDGDISLDGDDSARDDQTVDTVDNPVVDNGADGDGIEMEEEEERPSTEHWRGMVLDPDTNTFRFIRSGNREAAKDIPKADQYKKFRPRDMKQGVRVSFANARHTMVTILKEEYEELYKALEANGIPRTIDGIYDKLYGENSRLMQALLRALKKEHHVIYRFLGTFYFAAELGKPPKHLEDHPNIKYDEYMDQESLNSIWRLIEKLGKDGKTTFIWEEIETSINEDCSSSRL